ncbi:hypothetical protein Sste5346_006375 [Sporothrix stenoceras]|uniref:Integral membrane protein n=1 Tax=Sporothrix stenoceras TaxID=5173 RepID=A0ABR3YYS3_9PEZI
MSFSPIPAYVFGTIFTGIGVLSFLAPETDYAVFGLPLEGASPASPTKGGVSPFVYAKGARDLAFGFTYFALQYRGLEEAVTIFSAVLCTVALMDGAIVSKFGGDQYKGKSWGHWGGLLPFGAYVAYRVQNSL